MMALLINQIVITPENGNVADGSAIGDIVNGTYKAMQLYTNSTAEISSYGAVIGGSVKFAEELCFWS